MKAIIFQGQGSQRKGMGAELFDKFPDLTAEASEVLGYSIREMCGNNPDGSLDRTEITQPAIYVVSVLRHRAGQSGMRPAMMAGHSLGEYVALHVSGAFGFADGLRLVQQRGRLMGQTGGGGLVAVIGYAAEAIERLIAEDELSGVEIANINAPEQVVVGGRKDRLQRLLVSCRTRGIRAVPLRVGGAFHTSQMRSAAEEYARVVAGVCFAPPAVPVLSNVTGEPHVYADIGHRLVEQIASPVQWVRCVETMLRSGVTDFVEIGSMQILTPMIDPIRRRWSGETTATPLPSASIKKDRTHGRSFTESETIGTAGGAKRTLAALDGGARISMPDSDGHVEHLPDWLLPELRSRSLYFVSHPALAVASRALEDCYRAEAVAPEAISAIAATVEQPFRERLIALSNRVAGIDGTRARRAAIRMAGGHLFSPGLTVAEAGAAQAIFATGAAALTGRTSRNFN